MNKGKKIYAVINGEIKEGIFSKPVCLIYIKEGKGLKSRFSSKVYTSKKDALNSENPVMFQSVKPTKKQWYDNLISLFKPTKKGAKK